MRVILETQREKKEKGHTGEERERERERYFENSFLLFETVCLDDLLDACQELEPTVFFRDVSMMKAFYILISTCCSRQCIALLTV